MEHRRHIPIFLRVVLVLVLIGLAATAAPVNTTAQTCGGILGPPCPTPVRTPRPTLTPPPKETPKPATPTPSGIIPTAGTSPTPKKSPKEAPADDSLQNSPTPSGGEEVNDDLPPGLEAELPELEIPNIPRTRARNTVELVRLLEPLTEYGVSLEQILIQGMGRFPVAGLAYYSDDWLNPRFNPVPHLHHGLDIFADFGTPLRSPDEGVVSRITNSATGGIGVWLRGQDGTSYYYAHLQEVAEGLRVGQDVEIGTVVGYVGDTGNAQGGAPHLHFEIHRGGATPPKPSVDAWLDEAFDLAKRFVDARVSQIIAERSAEQNVGRTGGQRAELEASMLLTVLDPVGGSVGLLPRIDLEPSKGPALSDRLLAELIRQRVAGYLFVPDSKGIHLTD